MVVVLCGVLINGVGLVVFLDYRKTGCVDAGAGGVIRVVRDSEILRITYNATLFSDTNAQV